MLFDPEAVIDWSSCIDSGIAFATLGGVAAACAVRSRRSDRATIARLEAALTSTQHALPGFAVGSVLLSASPGTNVGGDIVDVFAIDRRFGCFLIADVCGKGVDAARDSAFVKFTLRTLALESDGDPAVILTRFNAIYLQTIDRPDTFVVLVLGVIDTQSGTIRYASAGHEPAFLRRAGAVALLPPTGPIVGALPYAVYAARTLVLGPGDALVLTTDGLTEARDRTRALLGSSGLAGWILAATGDAAAIARDLIARLRRRTGGRIGDDVAVLVLTRATGAPPSAGREHPRVACLSGSFGSPSAGPSEISSRA